MPERQGREYVALLDQAIRLSDGLSVDDRFDLVLLRNPDGSLGQLVYAGMDRVARADVELMKWTDGARSSGSMPTASAATAARHGDAGQRPPDVRLRERFHPILGYGDSTPGSTSPPLRGRRSSPPPTARW